MSAENSMKGHRLAIFGRRTYDLALTPRCLTYIHNVLYTLTLAEMKRRFALFMCYIGESGFGTELCIVGAAADDAVVERNVRRFACSAISNVELSRGSNFLACVRIEFENYFREQKMIFFCRCSRSRVERRPKLSTAEGNRHRLCSTAN